MGKYYPNTEQCKDRQRQDDLRSDERKPLKVTLYKFLRYHSVSHIVGLCPAYFLSLPRNKSEIRNPKSEIYNLKIRNFWASLFRKQSLLLQEGF